MIAEGLEKIVARHEMETQGETQGIDPIEM